MMSSCLNDKTIIDYFSGNLSLFMQYLLKRHIASCDTCLNNLLIIHQMLKDQTSEDWKAISIPSEQSQQLLRRINRNREQKYHQWHFENVSMKSSFKDLFHKKLGEIFSNYIHHPVLQPIPVLRSINQKSMEDQPIRSIHLKKQFDDLHTDILFQRSTEHHVSIHIQVKQNNMPAKNVRLTCIRKGDGFDSRLLKDKVIFQDCPFDCYQLIIAQHAIEKGSFEFEINLEGINEK